MKHTLAIILILCLALSLLTLTTTANEEPEVYVTISFKGELVATQIPVTIHDYDADGAYTINDALYGVHEQKYEGGASAGYGYYSGDYGLSMSKLWGDESGAYGYYLNNASCMSLADPIKHGDQINAFVYASSDWSDVYTYFDVPTQTVEVGEEIALTLMAAGYDENWNPITYPVEGATIMIDGAPTGIVTDKNGKATFRRNVTGITVISAKSQTQTLVPPVCSITVTQATAEIPEEQEQGCGAIAGSAIALATLLGCVMIKRKEN